jgi:carboxyl-terminal processing protease
MRPVGLALAGFLAVMSADGHTPGAGNTDFEQRLPDGTPTHWYLQHGPGKQSFTSDKGRHGKGGRLQVSGGSAAIGSVTQMIDPAPYRGKLIRLRLTYKAHAPSQAGPFLTVLRPAPYQVGFIQDDSSRPAPVGKWREVTITGRVAQDATAIWIGLKAVGTADVTIDDVRLEELHGADKPPSRQATTYLDQAIAILRARHINSAKADWSRLTSEAHAAIAGAETPADTYSAIRTLIGELGVAHSFFMPPPTRGQIQAATRARISSMVAVSDMPASSLLNGQVGVVRMPGLDTVSPGGTERSKAYVTTLRALLKQLDKAPLCGWIVDLRPNTGGNMWPMLTGLDPLLGASPFGFFLSGGTTSQAWIRTPDGISPGIADPSRPLTPSFALAHATAPVALLIGPQTASSGEMIALALIGRQGVRTFGGNTSGFLSGNTVQSLPDGAHIAVTEVLVSDRTGKSYPDTIHPDVVTDPDGAEPAAHAWLRRQCTR